MSVFSDQLLFRFLQDSFGSPVIPVVTPIDGGLRMRVLNPDHVNQWLTATGDAILNYVLHDSSLNLNDL